MKTLVLTVSVSVAVGLIAGAAVPLVLSFSLPSAGEHGAWYASRAAGLVAYLALWLSLAGGLLMSSAWFDGIVNRARLLAAHQALGVVGVALGLGHALVLIPDGWTTFTLGDLFVPFASYYRPAESALGTISLYLAALVTFSFWFRNAIGPTTWRWVHRASVVAYVAALWHGLTIGSDAGSLPVRVLYIATSFLLIAALTIRLTYARPRKSAPARVPPSRAPTATAG
ncbi:ferric reductase-like transmembrane domain-containing protein [Tepidiforma sp.]|uniref:ferric reductase-like transmembrane domain-containing protein n=1 Tax=Tepidiforma sp. TaxID=2682230 RepID=UPI002ADD430D|nr:ferric reductase-like transmembrane domain-containing protein [Tepidiforma sp.]